MLTVLFCLFLILFLYEFVRYRKYVNEVNAGTLNCVYKPSLLYAVIIGIIVDSLVQIDKVLGD